MLQKNGSVPTEEIQYINKGQSHVIARVKRGKFKRIFQKEVREMYHFETPGTGTRQNVDRTRVYVKERWRRCFWARNVMKG